MSSRATTRSLGRYIGLLCTLLVALTATAELCHAHGALIGYSTHKVSADTPETVRSAGCTLCAAGHSPAIKSAVQGDRVVRAADRAVRQHSLPIPSRALDFALAVRPPPAQD